MEEGKKRKRQSSKKKGRGGINKNSIKVGEKKG